MISTSKAREIALDLIEQFAAQEEILLFTLNQSPQWHQTASAHSSQNASPRQNPHNWRTYAPAKNRRQPSPVSTMPPRAEGWDLVHSGHLTDGSPIVTIQHIIREDEPHPIFPNDPATWAHVVRLARDGSHLHIQALDLACRIERLGIEASCGTW